ncbi:peroxisomal testis-specific protein 1 [Manis javanica]|uniref:peroxisomal testis-specific protein 1 n=1 Tax=Manis javanica TaxID=9974 RepID=UPI0008133A74|nr:peroxisomal testis-specific protein 1 [Manis javanica]
MKKTHDAIVYEPEELLNTSPKVTNCCKLWVKYSFQRTYMTRLVCSQAVSAMPRKTDHSPPPQPKVNIICQSLHQEEIIQELTMKLRHIGDSIDHRMAQEALQQEGRDALAHFVFIFFGGVHGLLRFLWNNHLV